jgi:hypothetical protein
MSGGMMLVKSFIADGAGKTLNRLAGLYKET